MATATRDLLSALAAAAYPDEGCGVLIGEPMSDTRREPRVTMVTRGRNLRDDRSRDRYELDPAAILAAERAARAAGLEVVGFWHSHPDHPAEPSAFDTERAWQDYVYLIVRTTTAGAAEARAWMLDLATTRFAELTLAVPEG